MGTVQSSLKLFDAMTRPLQNITQGMNMMISTMHQMQAATDQNVNIDKSLTAAKQKIASAEADIRASIDQSNAAQQRFNKSAESGERSFGKIGAAVIVLNQGLELAKKLWDTVNGGMTYADEIASANSRLGLVNDGLRTQAELQQRVMDAADNTRASYTATADLVTKLGMFTEGVFKDTEGMVKFAEQFNKLLVAGGANAVNREIATLQMSQALGSGRLQGDELRSISEASPLLLKTLADGMGVARGELKQLGADGKLTADVIVKAFENQSNQIDVLFAKMPMKFGDATTIMQNRMAEWVGKLNSAQGPLQKLTKLMQEFTAWLDSPSGQNFFNTLSTGIIIVSNLLYGAAHAAAFFYNTAVEYWPILAGILAAIAYIYLPIITASLWAMAQPIWSAAMAWLAMYWPILLIGAAIGVIIYALIKMGVTAEQVVGTVTGIFYTLFAFIYNQVAFVYNVFAAFGEFLINVFIDPVYAIQKLFYDLATVFLGHMYNMNRGVEDFVGNFTKVILGAINKALEGFNWLVDSVNNIFGTKFNKAELFDTNNVHVMSDGIKHIMDQLKAPTTDKNVVHIARMQEMDLKGSFDKGYQAGKGIVDKVSNVLDGFKLPGMDGQQGKGDIGNVDRVGSIGSIDDTVDVSSEDLKVMRDLAEMKAIQNFVTLTPTVNVTTGPVSKETDVDEIIRRIEESMDQEIESSAQGIYDIG